MLTLNKGSSIDFEDIKSIFSKKKKPWCAKAEPKLYNWETSIPESWIKLYGKQSFQKITKNTGLRISARVLNNNREFLHTISSFSPRAKQKNNECQRRRRIIINLAELSKGLDLENKNKYIAERVKKNRTRSSNYTPLENKIIIY